MDSRQDQTKSFTSLSQSPLWKINTDYYQSTGLEAWRSGAVPHQISSNSRIAKTIAELILGYLKDISRKSDTNEIVYIVELGAGHGRLAYHILKHLDRLIALTNIVVPKYCYVLTDIIEESLQYFLDHSQLEDYFKSGKLDVSYFDVVKSEELYLRYTKQKITKGSLYQSTIVVANYLFDSIPTDLFQVEGNTLLACHVDFDHSVDRMNLTYHKEVVGGPVYPEVMYNDILEDYRKQLDNSHFYFPNIALDCLSRVQQLSSNGLMLISCDKGFHELHDLQNMGEPDVVCHGSFSLMVNFNAMANFCKLSGGVAYLPAYATNALQCVCLLFENDHGNFEEVNNAYERFVNDFGPDDYITLKKMSYDKIASLSTEELVAMIRLSNYDSTIFQNYLPRLKQLSAHLSMSDRRRLSQVMHRVWDMYFTINEPYDLPFELGGFYLIYHFMRKRNSTSSNL